MASIADAQAEPVDRWTRFKRFAPFLLLGPVSGPLAAAMVHNFRQGRPVLATLYGVALVSFVVCLPIVTGALGLRLVV